MSRSRYHIDRHRRARMAGASAVLGEGWDSAVERAIAMGEREAKVFVARLQAGDDELPPLTRELHEICGHGCIPVRAKSILDAEAALQEALAHAYELEELAEAREIGETLRARLRAKLAEIRAALQKKLAPDVN